MILNALHGEPLPVYGDGMQIRNWIHVEDFGRGIGTRSSTASRARPTTSAARTRRRTWRSSAGSSS